MTATLKLDSTGDLAVEDGKFILVYDDDAIRQAIQTRLKHFKGEYFRDTTAGTDWFGKVLGKRTDVERKAELTRRISAVDGVSRIASMEFTGDAVTRELEMEIVVVKDDGYPLDIRFRVGT